MKHDDSAIGLFPHPSARPRLAPALLAFWGIYSLLAAVLLNPTIHGHDGMGHYAPLRSLLFDGDWDYANEYALFDEATAGAYRFGDIPIEAETGRPGGRYGVGCALLWAPFALAARMLAPSGGAFDSGLEPRYAWAIGLASAFYAGLGLCLLLAFCRRHWGAEAGWIAVAAALCLSPLAFYAFFHTAMSHACSFFAAMALLFLWDSTRRRPCWGRFAAWGAAAGLTAMVRPQDAALAVALGLVETLALARLWIRGKRRLARRRLAGAALAAGCAVLAFAPQMLEWKFVYGSFFSGPAAYMRYDLDLLKPVHGLKALFSSNHGLLFWHPAWALAAVGLAAAVCKNAPRGGRWPALAALAMLLAVWHVVACWPVWHAGASFGNRFFLSALAALGAGWAALHALAGTRRGRATLWILLVLGGIWNAGLAAQYGAGMIPREGEVAFGELARNQFTRVPALVARQLGAALRRSPDLGAPPAALPNP